jgi:MFS family permease
VPRGVVGAGEELGSVLGPRYGAVVLSVASWRAIFWVNLAVGLVLAAAISTLRAPGPDGPRDPARSLSHGRGRLDWVALGLLALALASMLLVMRQPDRLVTSVDLGGPFVPFRAGWSVWFSPLGLVTALLGAGLTARLLTARHPLVDLRDWWATARRADLVGAALLSVSLGGIILAFATADPEVQVFSPAGPWYLALAAVAAGCFVVHQRRAAAPLVPRDAFAARPAWGSLAVSFFVGAALIAALVDVPIFARVTIAGGDQLKAALVLVELLVALPVGALLGGALLRRVAAGPVAAAGMALAALGFLTMAGWDFDSLRHLTSSFVLAGTGLGFGLALAPVNAALLASTADAVHGVTSALLVVARMVGMLVGISALTTIGLRRYYAVQTDIPSANDVCGGTTTRCAAYTRLIEQAGIEQLQAIFLGAAICAVVAGVLALACFRGTPSGGRSHVPAATLTH